MKRQLLFTALLCMASGISIGYFLSHISPIQKSVDSISDSLAAIPSAMEKMDGFSDYDIAIMLRMYNLSMSGKPPHADKLVTRHIARYHQQRSTLSDAENHHLGAIALLPKIDKLRDESPELDAAFKALEEKTGK